MVKQLSIRGENISISSCVNPHAKVDIVKCDCEVLFIEAAYLVENFSANCETCCSYCCHLLYILKPVDITRTISRKVFMGMTGDLANSNNYASMLNSSI